MLRSEGTNKEEVNAYLQTLSPSGIELEFLSLSTFDLDKNGQDKLRTPNDLVRNI